MEDGDPQREALERPKSRQGKILELNLGIVVRPESNHKAQALNEISSITLRGEGHSYMSYNFPVTVNTNLSSKGLEFEVVPALSFSGKRLMTGW